MYLPVLQSAPSPAISNAPRGVLLLPNGHVLVVESHGPGIEPAPWPKNIISRFIIGAAHSPVMAGNLALQLRDTDVDEVAIKKIVLIDKLNSLFGIAVARYVAKLVGGRDIVFEPSVPQDSTNRRPDLTIARQILPGWTCHVPYQRGVAIVVDWFREELARNPMGLCLPTKIG